MFGISGPCQRIFTVCLAASTHEQFMPTPIATKLMPTPKRDEVREERITMEIIVDCYDEHEAWSGWSCYLGDKLTFPFQAECIRTRRGSLLKAGEQVTVTSLLDDDEPAGSPAEMQVMIEWRDRTLAVPLAQLVGVGVSEQTAEAIADWHYWVAQGRQF